jgi:predicted TIM-barrel fold metal-dependent hydrolase
MKYKIIDCHVHFFNYRQLESIIKIKKAFGYDKINILSIAMATMYIKATYGNKFYIFGAPDYSSLLTGSRQLNPPLRDQVDTLIKIGFDGIKMVEGKPSFKKDLKIPSFDSELFKDYFEYIESLQYPILWHFGDPKTCWDPNKISNHHKAHGWTYWDKKIYPTIESLYTEIEHVLERWPKLKIIFAHFFFMSDDLERASKLFDNYKNINFDLTPNQLMYSDFAANHDESRTFFMKYRDRILFGTDSRDNFGQPLQNNIISLIRTFLETDSSTDWGIGLKLPKHVCEKMYAENFERIVGKTSREINICAAVEECERLTQVITKLGLKEVKNRDNVPSNPQEVKEIKCLLEEKQ